MTFPNERTKRAIPYIVQGAIGIGAVIVLCVVMPERRTLLLAAGGIGAAFVLLGTWLASRMNKP
jgi:hypothetical protein